jgi:two-component sensor histidine kinase
MMEALLLRTSTTSRLPFAARYGLTTLLVLLVCAVRMMLGSLLTASPFLLFIPAVFLAAVLFNAGTALYATLLSAGLVVYFFVEPVGTLTVNTHVAVSLGFYVGIGGLIAGLTGALRRAMERARAAERAKDLLLHEVNHRIRNDLQILTSLVSLQRHKTSSPEARQALGVAMERITVLARVYDRLSHHDSTTVVDTHDFLSSLVDDLRTALVGERPITITEQLDRVALTLECALPLGLIINELLTNALKYAFPGAQSGRIEISFVQRADIFVLRVRDNGVGLSEAQPPGRGLGQQLVHRLATQLSGTVLITGDAGVCVEMRFPVPSCLAPSVPPLQHPAASGTLS